MASLNVIQSIFKTFNRTNSARVVETFDGFSLVKMHICRNARFYIKVCILLPISRLKHWNNIVVIVKWLFWTWPPWWSYLKGNYDLVVKVSVSHPRYSGFYSQQCQNYVSSWETNTVLVPGSELSDFKFATGYLQNRAEYVLFKTVILFNILHWICNLLCYIVKSIITVNQSFITITNFIT